MADWTNAPPDSAPRGTLGRANVEADDSGPPVTRELVRAFLAKKATQDRIRQVVRKRLPPGSARSLVDEIVQEVNMAALETTALARSVATLRPWISRIAQNAVIDHFRADEAELEWLDPSRTVDELPEDEAMAVVHDPTGLVGERPVPVEMADERLLAQWLTDHVESPGERMVLEMLQEKARTGKTHAVVAAEYGLTEAAFDNRLLRFKAKWIPLWKREREKRLRLVVFLILGAFVALCLILWWLQGPGTATDGSSTATPLIVPDPSAADASQEGPFNQAFPTQDAAPPPPEPGPPTDLKPRP